MTDIRWAEQADDGAVAAHVAKALAQGGRLTVPGGKTPASILRRLAEMKLPWHRITVSLTDDRDVPREHPASNFGALGAALGKTGAKLEGVTVGRARLAWIGMGVDGHVASVFPGGQIAPSSIPATLRVVPEPLPPEAPYPRLTLNYAALADAEEIILVARGDQKRRLLIDAAFGDGDLPVARLLRTTSEPVTIFWSSR
jgi:6-phosphogluconolactonase